MKQKLLSLLTIAMLSIGIIAFATPAKADVVDAFVYCSPADHTEDVPVIPPYPTWTVDVKLANVTDLINVAVSISYNVTAVNITAITPDWTQWTSPGSTTVGSWDPSTGTITDYTMYTTLPNKAQYPDNRLLTLSVQGRAFTNSGSVIDITSVYVADGSGNENTISPANDHTVYINKVTVPPYSPTAAFTWVPMFPLTGVPVNFNGGTSTGGYDGNAGTTITHWAWDWENDGIIDENNTVATTSHIFASAIAYSVNLTVYAPPGPGADPTYVPWGSIVKVVTVSAPAAGRQIDLYTQDWRYPDYMTDYTGIYPAPSGSQVDSYAPQDLVILYAKLTYNGEPISNKEVAFEIHGPTNPYQNIVIYRQVFTNCSGVAYIEFRIPWPNVNAEEIVFGVWTAMAKASVANQWVADIHWWYVHWIVDIRDEDGIQRDLLKDGLGVERVSFEELETVFVEVNITNWAMMPRNITFTAVIYDELLVPVGSCTATFIDVPPGESSFTLPGITIPEWAYVGWGWVYVNAFTMLPWDCGVCYCPESPTPIQILPTDPHIHP